MHGRLLAGLLLFSLWAGCTASPEVPGVGRLCWVTTWSEPGFYERAALDETVRGYRLNPVQPTAFVPAESATLDSRWGPGNYAFSTAIWPRSSVSIHDPTPTYSFYVWDQTVRGDVPGAANETLVRSTFLEFARAIAAASPAQLDAWADEFMRQRTPEGAVVPGQDPAAWDHHVRLQEPYRLPELILELEARNATVQHSRPGSLTYAADGWNVSLSLATKQVLHDSSPTRVEVDVQDLVAFYAAPKEEIMGRDEGWAARNATFEALGWAIPTATPAFSQTGEFCTKPS